MASSNALQKRGSASVEIAESLSELREVLVQEHGFLEKPLPTFEAAVPAGLYLERRRDGFIAWSPAPHQDEGHQAIAAVELLAHRGDECTSVVLRRVVPKAMKVNFALLGAASACGLIVPALPAIVGSSIGLWPFVAPMIALAIPWVVLVSRTARYYRRADPVWAVLCAALAPLALPATESRTPYRR